MTESAQWDLIEPVIQYGAPECRGCDHRQVEKEGREHAPSDECTLGSRRHHRATDCRAYGRLIEELEEKQCHA